MSPHSSSQLFSLRRQRNIFLVQSHREADSAIIVPTVAVLRHFSPTQRASIKSIVMSLSHVHLGLVKGSSICVLPQGERPCSTPRDRRANVLDTGQATYVLRVDR
jgi:hypothetical protein